MYREVTVSMFYHEDGGPVFCRNTADCCHSLRNLRHKVFSIYFFYPTVVVLFG